jgi:flagellar hook assembly protein FlgD
VRELMLAPGFPNPFRGRTVLSYALPRTSDMSLVIYDASGRRIRTLIRGRQQPGRYQASWDGRDERGGMVSRGVYFCALRTGAGRLQQKLVLLK